MVTSGEPAGVGPELCLTLADSPWASRVVVLADRDLLSLRASALGRQTEFLEETGNWRPGALRVRHVPVAAPVRAGVLDPRNAAHVLQLLDMALKGCQQGRYAGMVTAPVHKGVINQAGIPFTGHTEYLAESTATPRVVMMLAGDTPQGPLRVALVTTHMPLAAVPAAVTVLALLETMAIVDSDLRTRFGLVAPRIRVSGLNPHAGEGGYLGREEIDVIMPAIAEAQQRGIHVDGPWPGDTLFTPPMLASADCVLAMYHDQGLAPLKYATFGGGINVTLGLPVIRTSVDHGTALELAGGGRADPGSLWQAVRWATEMADRSGSKARE